MSAADIIQISQTLPAAEKLAVIRTWLGQFGQSEVQRKTAERLLRRLEHPEIPEDVWEGFEECENGRSLEMKDEHFANPPV